MDVSGNGSGAGDSRNVATNMNFRDWGFLDSPTMTHKRHVDLQLMSSMSEKPLFGGVANDHQPALPSVLMASGNGGQIHNLMSDFHVPVEYWMNQIKDNSSGYYHQPPSFSLSLETSSSRAVYVPVLLDHPKNENAVCRFEELASGQDNGNSVAVNGAVEMKAHGDNKVPKKERKPRNMASNDLTPHVHRSRILKKATEVIINGATMNISKLPIPVCTCTGTSRQCYRWGSGGWQSACCTTCLCSYPLPMSTKRRGTRIAGRKMSIGAFKKVLEKLSSEGYDFSTPIDLRNYWAKHGTNKFVTIR